MLRRLFLLVGRKPNIESHCSESGEDVGFRALNVKFGKEGSHIRDVAEWRRKSRNKQDGYYDFGIPAHRGVSAYVDALCSREGIICGVGADQISLLDFYWAYQQQIKGNYGLDASLAQKLLWPATGPI